MTPAAAGPRATGAAPPRTPFARLMLERLPQEARIGLTLGFVRTFGVPEIAGVLHGTGRMTSAPKARAKATGAALFALLDDGTDGPQGREIVAALRRTHERPGITPELMRYVLACFTVCPVRLVEDLLPDAVTAAERASAYAFHTELAHALGLSECGDGLIGPGTAPGTGTDAPARPPERAGGSTPGPAPGPAAPATPAPGPTAPAPGADADPLAGVDAAMAEFERRRFRVTPQARALWAASSAGLVAARLPGVLAPLAPVVGAALLDAPLARALGVRRPPAPLRGAVRSALRSGARRHAAGPGGATGRQHP